MDKSEIEKKVHIFMNENEDLFMERCTNDDFREMEEAITRLILECL